MNKNPHLIMVCGLPASGKSTISKELEKKHGAIILSSDKLREELYSNIDDMEHNAFIFEELHRRVFNYLEQGRNVVYDATNINSNRRRGFLSQFNNNLLRNVEKEIYYFNTSLESCIERNKLRDRKVPESVIRRMYSVLKVPMYNEGWDNISIVSPSKYYINDNTCLRETFEKIILEKVGHDALFRNLSVLDEFYNIYDLPQDSSYHTFSVSRHTYHVYEYIYDNYIGEDRLIMLWSALLHDIGKYFCKRFYEGDRYAHFIGHENVSGQISVDILTRLGYSVEFILKVVELVQLHMRLPYGNNPKSCEKLLSMVGQDVYNKLITIREADQKAM